MVFQSYALYPHKTVLANIVFPLRAARVAVREREARVGELLELVGLARYADRRPDQLSGGERQRVALARALAVRPRLLLLDEPLSALDRRLRERLATELHDILRAEGTTALLVTHDQEEAFAVADRMAVMRQGRIVQAGTLDEVWRHPVDAETARFLGYAAVVAGVEAERLARGWPGPPPAALALRRSALEVDADGSFSGVVVTARVAPDRTRLVVDVDEVGRLDAVAGPELAVRPGERVRLRLEATRAAALSGT